MAQLQAILGLMATLLLAELAAHSIEDPEDPIHTDVSQITQPRAADMCDELIVLS